MKAHLIVIGCAIIGALVGLAAGLIVCRHYAVLFGIRYFRSIDEPYQIWLRCVCVGASLGALLGGLVGAISVRTEERSHCGDN